MQSYIENPRALTEAWAELSQLTAGSNQGQSLGSNSSFSSFKLGDLGQVTEMVEPQFPALER
jgi:hypothetical protein